MIPEPLHPAVVHFPIVLVTLLPLVAGWALWRMRSEAPGRHSWLLPFSMAAALAGSAWVAVQTGDAQEERVEHVVADQPLETHEEAGEQFLLFSGLTVLLMVWGLFPGRGGQIGRVAGTLGAVALLVAGVRVGHSGGQLTYQHGAAAAWALSPGATSPAGVEDDDDID